MFSAEGLEGEGYVMYFLYASCIVSFLIPIIYTFVISSSKLIVSAQTIYFLLEKIAFEKRYLSENIRLIWAIDWEIAYIHIYWEGFVSEVVHKINL